MRSLVGVLVGALILLAVNPALAHSGSGAVGGLAAGFMHPLTGIDHLLAMILVGLWAAQLGGRALWIVPLSFVLLLAVGGGAAMMGITLPQVELVIAFSVVILGAVIAGRVQAPAAVAAAIVAIFGIVHGHAHGTEMPAATSEAGYAVSFVLATIVLHGIGIAASMAARSNSFVRYVGGASAVLGLALLG
jgi:urease accessory protein